MSPRLLGDTLKRALDDEGADVVVLLDDLQVQVTSPAGRFDLLVTDGTMDADVDADATVEIGTDRPGDVEAARSRHLDLDALTDLVRHSAR